MAAGGSATRLVPAQLRSQFVPGESTAECQVLAMNLPLYLSPENGGNVPLRTGQL